MEGVALLVSECFIMCMAEERTFVLSIGKSGYTGYDGKYLKFLDLTRQHESWQKQHGV